MGIYAQTIKDTLELLSAFPLTQQFSLVTSLRCTNLNTQGGRCNDVADF